jgi:glucose/arabinose dehydrogenase
MSRIWKYLRGILAVIFIPVIGYNTTIPPVSLLLVAEGLTAPTEVVEVPDGSGRLLVADQVGQIWVLVPGGTPTTYNRLPQPFLDLSGKLVTLNPAYDERGLLGLALHPHYELNGKFYVYYTAPLRAGGSAGYNSTATFAEYKVSANPNLADPASERILLQVDKPQFNHNGGTIAFGPDGYLYLTLGDGGGGNDLGLGHVDDWYPDNGGGNGQDITQNLLGSILRIDVDHGDPYAIPPDNPFVNMEGLDEIYAYGFRNPYRLSFDKAGKLDLIVSDAGQNLWEEIDKVDLGGNYGWNVREGTHCFDAENPTVMPPSCPSAEPDGTPLLDPVIEYPNNGNPAVPGIGSVAIGGVVYRGELLPKLRGRYLFGDWSTSFTTPDGSLFVATPVEQGLWPFEPLPVLGQPDQRLNHFLRGFGQDSAGEVYLLVSDKLGPDGTTGKVYKLVN